MKIHLSHSLLSFDEMNSFPRDPIRENWQGQTILSPPQYSLALDPGFLFLSFLVPQRPFYHEEYKAQEFREGLWERDVAEIFVLDRSGSQYQEFNIAPSGAWWSGGFTQYRERMKNFERPNAVTSVMQSDNGWSGSLKIERSSLMVHLPEDLNKLRMNVTFILSKIDVFPRQEEFFALGRDSMIEPDYHRMELAPQAAVVSH